jgi:hypothetical protein
MRKKMDLVLMGVLLAVTAGISSCRPYAGLEFYSRSPRFTRNHPSHVMLLTHRPRRAYVELGVVRIKPKSGMTRHYVENKLRKKAARMGADAVVIISDGYSRGRTVNRRYGQGTVVYRKRFIAGIAIRFR